MDAVVTFSREWSTISLKIYFASYISGLKIVFETRIRSFYRVTVKHVEIFSEDFYRGKYKENGFYYNFITCLALCVRVDADGAAAILVVLLCTDIVRPGCIPRRTLFPLSFYDVCPNIQILYQLV